MSKRDYKAVYSPQRKKARIINSKVGVAVIKPSLAGSTDIPANIKVAVRVRPPSERELNGNHRLVVKTLDKQMLIFDPKEDETPFFYQGVQQATHNYIKKANKEMQFVFDNVFNIEASNEDVFVDSTKNLITSLMEGYNCSVFVYGATGAGKTHTMLGYSACPGITYLTMQELFKNIEDHRGEKDFDICVSYLEIYNENVHDLLRPSGPLNIRDGAYGVVVSGLHSEAITTAKQLLDMLDKGNRNRTQHPTDANAESSRSHAVFQVYVKMRNKMSGQVKIVKLSMIDLAGSERASATGCKGERFKEGANINRSLLALGNCINQLADGSKFIPYRDSKLTRLLKDSLGGNCYTVMIANIAPTSLSYEDTYNTLKYATRANKIQLRMKKNIVTCDGHVSQYIKRVEELTQRVKQLEAELLKAQTQVKVTADDASFTANSKVLTEWQNKLDSNVRGYWEQLKGFLRTQSRQKGLVHRAFGRRRAAAALSALCCDYDDSDLIKTCDQNTKRLLQAADTFITQATAMNPTMLDMWNHLQTSESNFKSLAERALKTAPGIAMYTNSLQCQRTNIILQAQEDHLKAISIIQYEEINNFHEFIRDSLKTLHKYYLYLKGYGKITKSMTQEYNDLVRKAKNARSITWEDEQDNVECDDTHIKYMLNLNVATMPSIPELPKADIQSMEPNEVPKFSPKPANLNTTYQTEKPAEEESLLESDDDLNATRTIETADKPYLVYPDANIHDVLTKSINPSDLNSTFVLTQKFNKKDPTPRKTVKLAGVQKRVLSEKTNIMDIKPKMKLSIDKTSKRDLIKNSILQEKRSAFGSSANRFQYDAKKNGSAGLKSIREKRTPLNSTPYMRPPPVSKTPPC